ncbi:MAG: alkaline phosphatase family protein [Chloroflexi bacterium]|nr:alkaline phosphatase family protein [Chloroflexota bacterium]
MEGTQTLRRFLWPLITSVALLGLGPSAAGAAAPPAATTPIQHVVVIFQENVSFDHYFGTYPNAANTSGQSFTAAPGTPAVDGLTPSLLNANSNGANPRRYDPSNVNDILTCDQDHNYSDEQKAFDSGRMDQFPQTVGTGKGKTPEGGSCVANDVMNYYDGNTVTAMWNYAQQFAMSDRSFGTTFGPSAPGAINLISGNTGSVDMSHTANKPPVATAAAPNADITADGQGGYSLTSDAQPYWDDCSTRDAVAMTGKNIGDLLNSAGASWGFFQGGFRPTTSFADAATATGQPGQASATFIPDEFANGGFTASVPHSSNQGICNAVHAVGVGLPGAMRGTGQYGYKDDYIPHHQPFQYYASTANPHHLTLPTDANGVVPISALQTVGLDTQHYAGGQPQFDTPNHQYDMSDFDQLVAAITAGKLPASALPAVSFLKASGYQDGHAAYSDPIDEQQFLVNEINALESSPAWKSTAVIIAYDDSDGWYDHAYPGVQNPSQGLADALTGAGACGAGTPIAGQNGRCGYGPRMPLLVLSAWAKHNFVDHTLTDQSSILRFVEDNWNLGRITGSFDSKAGSLATMFDYSVAQNPVLLLDPNTGLPAPSAGASQTSLGWTIPVSGSSTGSSGGSLQTYSFVGDGSLASLTLRYSSPDPTRDPAIGMEVFGGGVNYGNHTASAGVSTASIPTTAGATYTVQVFNYLPALTVQYSLVRS